MATLTGQDRLDLAAEIMRLPTGDTANTKAEWQAAVAAADDWAEANTASYNAALPTAFRTSATPAQKALVLMHVIARRWLKGV